MVIAAAASVGFKNLASRPSCCATPQSETAIDDCPLKLAHKLFFSKSVSSPV